ncbi:hypothetical protein C8R45DRAFT_1057105 [Mycena sanguinolenta]|nr:hypothetical protein C8R45DRAFT_1057105 [Mycena sanguinolenta]
MSEPLPPAAELLEAFRIHFHRYPQAVNEAITNQTDEVVLSRLFDDLQEYTALVAEHTHVFPAEELAILQTNLSLMLNDIRINPEFLQFAHEHRSTSGVAQFLGISRGTVRSALLREEFAQPQTAPFECDPEPDSVDEANAAPPPTSTGGLSTIEGWELDSLLLRLWTHFRCAGLSILDGMLRRLSHHVQRTWISESLCRIDPVHRVFQRIRIRRQHYHVTGPNALWHHDGQHGASIHNVRIERLWVDVTAQVGATRSDIFTLLELHHGLEINNVNHIWLLHYLFLPTINDQLTLFMGAWNEHKIQIRNGPSHSPADMFGFDMLVHGARGHALTEELSDDELKVYGVNWEGLYNEALLSSQRHNNVAEDGWTSWIGCTGPPEHLNEVPIFESISSHPIEKLQKLNAKLEFIVKGLEYDQGVIYEVYQECGV